MDKLVRVEVGDKKEMSREIMFLVLLLTFILTLYDNLHQMYWSMHEKPFSKCISFLVSNFRIMIEKLRLFRIF